MPTSYNAIPISGFNAFTTEFAVSREQRDNEACGPRGLPSSRHSSDGKPPNKLEPTNKFQQTNKKNRTNSNKQKHKNTKEKREQSPIPKLHCNWYLFSMRNIFIYRQLQALYTILVIIWDFYRTGNQDNPTPAALNWLVLCLCRNCSGISSRKVVIGVIGNLDFFKTFCFLQCTVPAVPAL